MAVCSGGPPRSAGAPSGTTTGSSRELARLVAVTARALDGDEFHRHAADGKIRKFRHLALHDHRAALALERLYAEENGDRAGARGAIEDDVHALAAGDFHDAGQRIF